ncbi:hypothetical protein [Nannocystis radixulma]|uniref:Lantibiotic dehydratase N-terminal domain-containing protein n=1 Tax=Nannocystis radixulma TaxID=2995305 RepID=A0ABT5BML8_9BACT|nr:hypothetical protein [Nannocystis radixulma]MDC0675403.1 hypothetical protein [Nannocystis radixulma]
MVRDVEEFRRLFRLSIPVREHAGYYVETLARSQEYAGLPALVRRFGEFEARMAERGQSIADYKHQQLAALRDELGSSTAFRRLCTAATGGAPPTRNRLSERAGDWMVSLDLREANFSVLRLYDEEQALGDGPWSEFCAERAVDPLLAESKSFRQLVFGYLEPKKVQRVQHALTAELADDLRRDGLDDHAIAGLSHDELVLAFPPDDPGLAEARTWIDRVVVTPRRPAVRATLFRSDSLEPGIEVRTFFESTAEGLPRERHRSLVGVPGNLFFLYFKRHILAAPLDPRDLYFRLEHRLAQWVVDDAEGPQGL